MSIHALGHSQKLPRSHPNAGALPGTICDARFFGESPENNRKIHVGQKRATWKIEPWRIRPATQHGLLFRWLFQKNSLPPRFRSPSRAFGRCSGQETRCNIMPRKRQNNRNFKQTVLTKHKDRLCGANTRPFPQTLGRGEAAETHTKLA